MDSKKTKTQKSSPTFALVVIEADETVQYDNFDMFKTVRWQLVTVEGDKLKVLAEKFPSALDYLLVTNMDSFPKKAIQDIFSVAHLRRYTKEYRSSLLKCETGFCLTATVVDGPNSSSSNVNLSLMMSSARDEYETCSVLEIFLRKKCFEDFDPHFSFSPAPLYEEVRRESIKWEGKENRPEGLADATLSYDHQLRALDWMCQRESGAVSIKDHVSTCVEEYELLWRQISDSAFYSPVLGKFSRNLKKSINFEFSEPRGGILADEMGMGKTVEVISLVLARPRSEYAPEEENSKTKKLNSTPPTIIESGDPKYKNATLRCYCCVEDRESSEVIGSSALVRCPFCKEFQHAVCVAFVVNAPDPRYACPDCGYKAKWAHERSEEESKSGKIRNPIQLRTTLIVCPETILPQWESELQRHVKSGALTVGTFKGAVPKYGKNAKIAPGTLMICRPEQFREFDVVLTTYDVMNHALQRNQTSESQKRINRRNSANLRFVAMPSPLLGCEWHRVCFDESQLLGEGITRAAVLSRQLRVNYRWAVSGTPISRSNLDVFGLMTFLEVGPYDNKSFWRKAIDHQLSMGNKRAETILKKVLRRIMWRMEKTDAEEVSSNMPGVEEHIYQVRFTEVEKYMYQRRWKFFDEKLAAARQRQRNGKWSEEHLSKLIADLGTLRLACCHPQLGQKTGLKDLSEGVMSAPAVFKQLIHTARIQAEERQRTRVFYLHGLAALHMAEQDWEGASSLYRQVLDPGEFDLHTDYSTLLHARVNLIEALHHIVLSSNDKKIKTIILSEIDDMQAKIDSFKNKYIAEAKAKFVQQAIAYSESIESISEERLIKEASDSIKSSLMKNGGSSMTSNSTEMIISDIEEFSYQKSPEKLPLEGGNALVEKKQNGELSLNNGNESGTSQNENGVGNDSSMDIDQQSDVSGYLSEEDEIGMRNFVDADMVPVRHRSSPNYWIHPRDSWWRVVLRVISESDEPALLRKVKLDLPKKAVPEKVFESKTSFCEWITKELNSLDQKLEVIDALVEEICGEKNPKNLAEFVPPPPVLKLVDKESCSTCISRKLSKDAKRRKYARAEENEKDKKFCVWCKLRNAQQALQRMLTMTPSNAFITALNSMVRYMENRISQRAVILTSNFLAGESSIAASAMIVDSSPSSIPEKSSTLSETAIIDEPTIQEEEDPSDEDFVPEIPVAKEENEKQDGVEKSSSHHLDEDEDEKDLDMASPTREKRKRFEEAEEDAIFGSESTKNGSDSGTKRVSLPPSQEESQSLPHRSLLNGRGNEKSDELDRISLEAIEGAKATFKAIEVLKRRTKLIDLLVDAHLEYTSYGEELKMMGTRMRARDEIEEGEIQFEQVLFEREEIGALRFEYSSKLKSAQFELQEQTSQLRYLTTQAEQVLPTNCPICWEQLPDNVLLLSCGHSGCPECLKRSFETAARCPLCRQKVNRNDFKVVSREGGAPPEIPTISNPSARTTQWGTKIDAIIACLRREMGKFPDEKFLIFSNWSAFLQLLMNALREASITALSTCSSHGTFSAVLDEFRADANVTVLCMPLSRGNKGANLMCASHIIFADPSLLTAAEAQAVGRIHRLGQTKKMKIHRFYVLASIEQSVFELSRLKQQHYKSNSHTGFAAQDRKESELTLDTLEKLFRGHSLENTYHD